VIEDMRKKKEGKANEGGKGQREKRKMEIEVAS
jgi:hypothetical protein